MDKEKIDSLITVAKDYGFVTLSHDDFLQLVRERDAAVSDLESICDCTICKYYHGSSVCGKCIYDNKFEWRGIADDK